MRTRTALLWLWLLPACDGGPADEGEATNGETTNGEATNGETTGADTETTDEVVPEFDADIQPILESACLCHFSATPGGDMTAPYLNLNAGFALGELRDVDSVQLPSMKRVAPGDAENSYLVHKLRGTHGDVGGPMGTDRMPPLAPLLPEDIMRIEAWIAAGAEP